MQLPLGCLSGTVVRMWYGSQLVNAVRLDMSGSEQSWEESISWRTHSGVETTLMCSGRYVFVRIRTYPYVLRTYTYVSARIDTYLDTFCIVQCFKDGMHAYDHGVAMNLLTAIIRYLHDFEIRLGIPKNTLVEKLTARMHNLCNTLDVKHSTLMSFENQSIVECLEKFTKPTKKGDPQYPIVDATDVQRLMLALPFLLDDLVRNELDDFNRGKTAAQRLADPMPAAIMAVNEWLHWYQLYRAEEADDDSNARLTRMGNELIATLQRVFPYRVKIAPRSDKTSSVWTLTLEHRKGAFHHSRGAKY